MDEILDMSASSERFQTVLLDCFAGAALLLTVGTLASLLPAWKAMRVDPSVALRQE